MSDKGEMSMLKKRKQVIEQEMGKSGVASRKIRKLMGGGTEEIQTKWWEDEGEGDGEIKWNSLEHHGVCFAPPYTPLGLKLAVNETVINLDPKQEEVCWWWAKILGTEFGEKPLVKTNFTKELKNILGKEHPFKSVSNIEFSDISKIVKEKEEEYRNRNEEIRNREKLERIKKDREYGWALIDGSREKMSSYLIEPPGIFRGRGEHPLAGSLKSRIIPEQVSINIGEESVPPRCPLPGHAWKTILHNHQSTWLASYKDERKGGSIKYIFLDATSRLKGQNDMKKYEKARKLKNQIGTIRDDYTKKMESKTTTEQQLGTAAYLIDRLALRVGNEKGEDEADTVGCCSLRCEHITPGEDSHITFDFLGKDSMRYLNTLQVDPIVYRNIAKFVKGKKGPDDLFDVINASRLNDYLKVLMPGLSAKVFRTYNASVTLQQEVEKFDKDKYRTIDEKIKFYNDANREVAILCNHQKSVPKNFDVQLEKMQDKLKEKLQKLKALEDHLHFLKTGKKKKQSSDIIDANKLPKTMEQALRAITNLRKTIDKEEIRIKMKEENKQVALGTSKINYMDPRISATFCKKQSIPIEKVFTKRLRDKFTWAMSSAPGWLF